MRSLSRNGYTTFIIRFRFSGKNTFYLPELATHLFHHVCSSASHSIHRQSAEKKCHHRTDEHTRQNFRIHQRNIIIPHKIGKCRLTNQDRCTIGKFEHRLSDTSQPDTNLFHIRSQQSETGKCSRTDSKSLSGSRRCISQRIEGIGSFSHLLAQTAHLSISSRIIGNRTISIGCQRDSQCRKHSHRSNTYTI